MTRRNLLVSTLGMMATAQPRRRPNVVFIMTDDHGAWSMGAYGCAEFHTPNLDSLARGGARFTNGFACTPVCSPSRMTYITGKLPSHHGVQDFLLAGDEQHFLAGQATYTEILARNGYAVGLSGKWHMGNDRQAHAGFSFWNTVAGGAGTFRDPEFTTNGRKRKATGFKEDLLTDTAIEFIEHNRNQPFFLYLPFFAPHTPYDYQPNEDRIHYKDTSFPCFPEGTRNPQRRRSFEDFHSNRESKTSYSALVTGVDRNVGRLVRRLDEMGLRDNTLIVFTADQGWNAGHHGVWGKGNATIPFNMYEESIRVPLIWNHPGRIQGEQVLAPIVSSYDFFPTILDYLGIEVPADPRRVGRSYAGFVRGQPPSPWRGELFFEYCHARAIRTERWKYVERADNWPSELFDLSADPSETTNVIGDSAYREELAGLRGRLRDFFFNAGAPPLDQWRSTTKQQLPLDSGYYANWNKGRQR